MGNSKKLTLGALCTAREGISVFLTHLAQGGRAQVALGSSSAWTTPSFLGTPRCGCIDLLCFRRIFQGTVGKMWWEV